MCNIKYVLYRLSYCISLVLTESEKKSALTRLIVEVLIQYRIVSNYFILDPSFHYIIIISKNILNTFRTIPNNF
jgi:hypothetical protein